MESLTVLNSYVYQSVIPIMVSKLDRIIDIFIANMHMLVITDKTWIFPLVSLVSYIIDK